MPTFTEATETTEYKTRLAVMVECDFFDDAGKPETVAQVTLTRLDNANHRGECLNDDDLKTIGTLRQHLGITDQKRIGVSRDVRNRRNAPGVAFLSTPLGPYYCQISLDYRLYNRKEVNEAWDGNPIEACEISMIPEEVSPDTFRSHRLQRCEAVVLHFAHSNSTKALNLLLDLKLVNCKVLELRNLRLDEAQKKVFLLRLKPFWPRLQQLRSI